jgi:hypothetical protein
MIKITSLEKVYGKSIKAVQALNGIDLVIGQGMFVARPEWSRQDHSDANSRRHRESYKR